MDFINTQKQMPKSELNKIGINNLESTPAIICGALAFKNVKSTGYGQGTCH